MSPVMNRRQWLKTSTLATTSLLVSSSFPSCGPREAVPEQPALQPGVLKLNSNESPYGISEKARQALVQAIDESHLYPHRKYAELIDAIAEREGLTPDHIILGGGSTEVMNMIIRAFGTAGPIVVSDPTYFDFIFYADQAGCTLESVPLNDAFEHDLETTLERVTPRTSCVYICNPNNPTGSITTKDNLQSFCDRIPDRVLIVVDEAYFEYAEEPAFASMKDLVLEKKNVVVTRTFSKIFGMAGLRVGYGMADPETIARLDRVSMNFAPVAFTSLKAALSAYADLSFLRTVRENNRRVRAYMRAQLNNLGYSSIPSHTNFVLFEVQKDASEMAREFEKKDILVRPSQFWDLNWIRVSLGTMPEMEVFVSALAGMA